MTSINEWAFGDCKNIKSITIPNNVTKIGQCAFFGCNQAIFYVGSEKTKQLILASHSNIDINKIIVKP